MMIAGSVYDSGWRLKITLKLNVLRRLDIRLLLSPSKNMLRTGR